MSPPRKGVTVKKVLKAVGLLIVVLVVAVGGFLTFVAFDWPVRKSTRPLEVKIEATPERLARGRSLVAIRCAGCHYNQRTGGLTGAQMLDAPKEFGTIYSHNITQHPTKGI